MDHETVVRLRRILKKRLNQSELRGLCFDLGVRYDDLPGDTTSDKVRELLDYFDRRDRVYDLIKALEEAYPEIEWGALASPEKEAAGSSLEQYIARMRNLLQEDNPRVIGRLGRAHTLGICRGLDSDGKGRVLRFVYDAGLIHAESPIIDLKGIDLSSASLARANLASVRLVEVKLKGANLEGADLTGADLRGSDLRDCTFTNAMLSNARLRGADLRRATLDGAELGGAVRQAGQVNAGRDSIQFGFALETGGIYSFVVTGKSMEQAGIYPGDTVVIQATSEEPSNGESVVVMYLPWPDPPKIIPSPTIPFYDLESFKGPTIKTYQGRGDPEGPLRLQGWATKGTILTNAIELIGKVATVIPTSPMRHEAKEDSRKREFVDLVRGEIIEENGD